MKYSHHPGLYTSSAFLPSKGDTYTDQAVTGTLNGEVILWGVHHLGAPMKEGDNAPLANQKVALKVPNLPHD